MRVPVQAMCESTNVLIALLLGKDLLALLMEAHDAILRHPEFKDGVTQSELYVLIDILRSRRKAELTK